MAVRRARGPTEFSKGQFFLIQICSEIQKKAMNVEGIFRTAGNKRVIDEYLKQIAKGKSIAFDKITDPYTLCGLLQAHLRSKAPLIPSIFYEDFISPIRNYGGSAQSIAGPGGGQHSTFDGEDEELFLIFQKSFNKLSVSTKQQILTLLELFFNVSVKSEVNKMNIPNLARVFGPTFFLLETDSPQQILGDAQYVMNATVLLIKNYQGFSDIVHREVLPIGGSSPSLLVGSPQIHHLQQSRNLQSSGALLSSSSSSNDTLSSSSSPQFNTKNSHIEPSISSTSTSTSTSTIIGSSSSNIQTDLSSPSSPTSSSLHLHQQQQQQQQQLQNSGSNFILNELNMGTTNVVFTVWMWLHVPHEVAATATKWPDTPISTKLNISINSDDKLKTYFKIFNPLNNNNNNNINSSNSSNNSSGNNNSSSSNSNNNNGSVISFDYSSFFPVNDSTRYFYLTKSQNSSSTTTQEEVIGIGFDSRVDSTFLKEVIDWISSEAKTSLLSSIQDENFSIQYQSLSLKIVFDYLQELPESYSGKSSSGLFLPDSSTISSTNNHIKKKKKKNFIIFDRYSDLKLDDLIVKFQKSLNELVINTASLISPVVSEREGLGIGGDGRITHEGLWWFIIQHLSMFVATYFGGGCSSGQNERMKSNLCNQHFDQVQSFGPVGSSKSVLVGELSMAMENERALLFKYLCSRVQPELPCSLAEEPKKGQYFIIIDNDEKSNPKVLDLLYNPGKLIEISRTQIEFSKLKSESDTSPYHNPSTPTKPSQVVPTSPRGAGTKTSLHDISSPRKSINYGIGLIEEEKEREKQREKEIEKEEESNTSSNSRFIKFLSSRDIYLFEKLSDHDSPRPVFRGALGPMRVAIKKFIKEDGGNRNTDQLTFQVLQAMQFSHPNIMTCFGYELRGNELLVCYELFPKRTVYDCISERIISKKNFALNEIQYLSSCILYSLKHIHYFSLSHTCLKSTEIFLDGTQDESSFFGKNTSVKIRFPIIPHEARDSPSFSSYAPESKSTDPIKDPKKLDIWDFGVILWELINLQHVETIEQDTIGTPLLQRKKNNNTSNSNEVSSASSVFSSLLSKCWKKEPDRRPSAKKMIELLESIVH